MHITKRQAKDALVWAVGERGAEYVDPGAVVMGRGCKYVYEGQPSCIAGMALFHLGVDLALLAEVDEKGADLESGFNPTIGGGAAQFLRENGVDLDDDAERVLDEAQVQQDDGNTWGQALGVALSV
jgi:hypothetical protein